MGVRESKTEKLIEPAIPGMILTIDKGSYKGKKKEKTFLSIDYMHQIRHILLQKK